MRRIVLLLSLCIFFCTAAFAQLRTISGTVRDNGGSSIPSATVTEAGTNNSVRADANGNFSIQVSPNARLIITAVGFQAQTVSLDNANSVQLVRSDAQLQEVIVTGYSTRGRRTNSASVATVDVADIRIQPIASFDQLLQGQAAGINVKAGSGQPGRSADVIIRGRGSITGSVTPLYIVDGIEIAPADFSTMNPGDFESVTVLKDAGAAAIYGSRGANGVIVVNTRKGRVGKTIITYDGQRGVSRLPENKLYVMNSAEKIDFERKMAGNPYGWTLAQADSLKNISTDWFDVVFRDANMQSHQVSASGGTDKTRFYASVGYLDQEGILRNSGLDRYTARVNVENSYNRLRVGANVSAGWSKYVGIGEGNSSIGNPLNTLLWALPYERPRTGAGDYTLSVQGTANWINPLEELEQNLGYSNQLKGTGNFYFDYIVPGIEGLTFRFNGGGDYSQLESFGILSRGTQRATSSSNILLRNGALTRDFDRRSRYTITNSLTYKTSLGSGKEHDITAAVYNEVVKAQGRSFGFTGYGLEKPFRNEAGLVAGTVTNQYIPTVRGGFPVDYGILSYFGTIDYVNNGKYVLSLNGRRDASSRLSPENRVIYYGSASAAWIVSDEAFLKQSGFVNFLKLRASYGSVGNQNGIGDFPYLQAYGSGTYGGQGTLFLSRLGNEDLTWERRRTANLGIDFGLFKDRVRGSVEYYNSLTKGLYFSIAPPATSSYGLQVLTNVGNMSNNGIEANLSFKAVNSRDFQWTIDANFAYNKNTIKDLPESQENREYSYASVLSEGKPFNSFYLVRFAGVDPQTGKSQYLKKDGKTITTDYDPEDRVILETSDAPYNGGFTNTFRFKGIELGVFWVYSLGNYIFNNARTNVEYPGYAASGFARSALRAWREPGDITDFPGMADDFQGGTTRFLENGSFWRLRNVQISYNLPSSLIGRLKLQNARFFLQGQNLYTYHKVQALDPEVSSVNGDTFATGIEGAQYPPLKTITFGVSIGF